MNRTSCKTPNAEKQNSSARITSALCLAESTTLVYGYGIWIKHLNDFSNQPAVAKRWWAILYLANNVHTLGASETLVTVKN